MKIFSKNYTIGNTIIKLGTGFSCSSTIMPTLKEILGCDSSSSDESNADKPGNIKSSCKRSIFSGQLLGVTKVDESPCKRYLLSGPRLGATKVTAISDDEFDPDTLDTEEGKWLNTQKNKEEKATVISTSSSAAVPSSSSSAAELSSSLSSAASSSPAAAVPSASSSSSSAAVPSSAAASSSSSSSSTAAAAVSAAVSVLVSSSNFSTQSQAKNEVSSSTTTVIINPGSSRYGSWNHALCVIADNPYEAKNVIQVDDFVVAVKDAYPKAKHHLLLIARDRDLDSISQVN